MRNEYRAILFDAGGTLIFAHFEKVFVDLCAGYGVNVFLEKVAEAYDHFLSENCEFMIRNGKLLGEDWQKFWNMCNEEMLRFAGVEDGAKDLAQRITMDYPLPDQIEWEIYPDVLDSLSRLKKENFLLGVVSNFDERLDGILNELNLSEYLDVVLTSHEAGVAKPNPQIFVLALERISTSPEDAVYVGDSLNTDVAGARNSGLLPVLLDRKDKHQEVDCVRIRDLNELPDVLP